jgi:hypothetical protein
MDCHNNIYKTETREENSESCCGRYSSVEFSITELSYPYQFKLWNSDSNSMQIIIKQDSEILNWLKVGNRFDTKYYSEEISSTMGNHETEISHMKKVDDGKFKGHYIVDLEVAGL